MRLGRVGSASLLTGRPLRLQRWWLDRPVRAKGLIVIAIPLIALTGTTSASLALQYNESQERHVALAARDLASTADQVLADAVNAETGVRGDGMTGGPLFLAPYNLALTRIGAEQTSLRDAAITEGDSHQQQVVGATTGKVLFELAQLRSAISPGVNGRDLKPALEHEKVTMD